MNIDEIKLKKRYKYAGDIFTALIEIGFDDETAEAFLNDIKDAEVIEVVHGRWIFDDHDECGKHYKCSACGRGIVLNRGYELPGYCPYHNCGAKMDGSEEK